MFSKLKIRKAYNNPKEIKIFGKVLYTYIERFYYLSKPLTFTCKNKIYQAPENTCTNLASIPILFKVFGLKPNFKAYIKSSILHDDGYERKLNNKFKTDWLYLCAMKTEQSEYIKNKYKNKLKFYCAHAMWFIIRWSFYITVSIFGWYNWYKYGRKA